MGASLLALAKSIYYNFINVIFQEPRLLNLCCKAKERNQSKSV